MRQSKSIYEKFAFEAMVTRDIQEEKPEIVGVWVDEISAIPDSVFLAAPYSGVSLTQANCYEHGFSFQDGRFI